MRSHVSCRPTIFGSTKYRKAMLETTKTPKPTSRRRVNTTRGISSSVERSAAQTWSLGAGARRCRSACRAIAIS